MLPLLDVRVRLGMPSYAVEMIDPGCIHSLPASAGEAAVSLTPRVATWRESKRLVSLVDLERLADGVSAVAA